MSHLYRAKLLFLLVSFELLGTPAARADDSSSGDEVMWGIGAKVRRWHVSKRVQRLFVEDSPGPAGDYGAGFDFARRQGRTEISISFGFDRLDLEDGYWLEKGGDPTVAGDVDHVRFQDLQWFTAEVAIVSHLELHKFLELRFGAGIGLGWVRGEILKTDAVCASDRVPEDCTLDPAAAEVDEPVDIPPVLPVVNLLVGLQLTPIKYLHLRVDAGLHSTPYVGAGLVLYFW